MILKHQHHIHNQIYPSINSGQANIQVCRLICLEYFSLIKNLFESIIIFDINIK